ncbi:MAG: carboxypeptidase-like regulatory domain-containing protein, partial [Ginsengibacter sp.]
MFTNTSAQRRDCRPGSLIFFLILFIFPASVFAQKVTVTGQIIGTDGTPISHASVLEQNTTNGTTSDSSGNFSIDVSNANATLAISSLGYTSQTIPLNGRTNITVTLQGSAAKELEQVVIVGYGTQRKRDITGAISTVKGAEIAKQPVLTATQAIQGKVAGVQIISSGAPNSAP